MHFTDLEKNAGLAIFYRKNLPILSSAGELRGKYFSQRSSLRKGKIFRIVVKNA